MNHTGTRSTGSPRQARKKVSLVMAAPSATCKRYRSPPLPVPSPQYYLPSTIASDTIHPVRRSIDDYPFDPADLPPGDDDEFSPVSWAVAIADDYEDAIPRVVLTIEEVGQAGYGLVAHLSPPLARRLRAALGDALKEIGEAASS